MFRHYLIGSFRNLHRFKSSSLVSVVGLALGLACFIAAYGAVIYLTTGNRQLKSIDRIRLIEARYSYNGPVGAYDTGFLPDGPYWKGGVQDLRAEFPDLSAVARVGLLPGMPFFGVARLVAERRAHEIGVRKAIGARSGQIVSMLLFEFSRPVVVANLCIWPVAYVAARAYLNLFTERVQLSPLPFAGSLLLALLLAWVAVGAQALRAARTCPASVLQRE